ncbi:hypothetical protein [Janthinobacterium fluminis]|uniref:DUF2116 family Zn-ribbon domain-containing protein n=1 Tax=Janthinobacterium fluminis TaxID=2987524 RepID=A0ABT5JYG5_9BURK|nr:hypothetical protein [Janthinobacterium fluminis]MDC8757521.1 hypothetical protein [Janthinobacterium fluminis]
MSDHADITDKIIFAAVRRGLDAVRRQPRLAPDCRCHYCDEEVGAAALFCGVDCRDDYDKERAAIARAGRAV